MSGLLNRSAFLLRPHAPYLAWAKQDDDERNIAESVFQSLRERPQVFLLPEWVDPESQRAVLNEFWPALFESMLEGWLLDATLWPSDRTRERFDEWFEVTIISMIRDLNTDDPLGCW
ncbi:MAG: hypothetical protein DHS20C15_24320 [Planctomycetota bacterium]|nr:MAG: hypothetical protein DHS20C15_24320 [Planctomycetota bacterium]